jgi:hypothetical protein
MDSAPEQKDPKVDLLPVIDAAIVGNQLLSPCLTISQNMPPALTAARFWRWKVTI